MGFDIECIIDIHTYPGEYFCPVCRTLVYPSEALQSQCTHLYCKPCLAHVANNTRACPYDGYLVTEADSKPLLESDKSLAENIGKVKVRCLYHRSGCTWEGSLSECSSHCSVCAFGNSPVICNRCGVQIVHRQVHDHAQTCPGVYQVHQAVEAVQVASSSGSAAANTAGNQDQSTTQPGVQTSEAQSSQSAPAPLLPGQESNQQGNASSQAPAAVPAAMPTPEQWYQQQYQQYYQQYAGYNFYQQAYQQYYPHQQSAVQQYQQHPSHVGQPQLQVYAQAPVQVQSQSQVQAQPQPLPHPQPQPQHLAQSQNQPSQPQPVQTQSQLQQQGQPQLHAHVQPHINTQQQLHPAMQSHPQIPHQSNLPHSFPAPPPQQYNQAQVQAQAQPHLIQPQPQAVQVPQYQQSHLQLKHPQPSQVQLQPHMPTQSQLQSQPQSQVQQQPHLQHHTTSYPQMRPSQLNQPISLNPQPQSVHASAHAVTGYQSYPQHQPPQQVHLGVPQQHPIHAHATTVAFPPGQIQGQLPQPPALMPPPASRGLVPNQQASFPSQGQVPNQPASFPFQGQVPSMPPAQQQQFHPQAPQLSHPVQQHPVIHPSQQSVPQQHVQQQLHMHSHLAQQQSMQSQLHPPGPPLMMQQTSHAYPQYHQNVALAPGSQPQPPQNYVGRPTMPIHGAPVQPQPFPQSSGGFGPAPQVRPAQLGLLQTSINQNYSINELQMASDQQLVQSGITSTSGQLQNQRDHVPEKTPVMHEAGLPSENAAEKVNNTLRADSVGLKALKSEADMGYKKEVKEESTDTARQSETLVKDTENGFHGGKDGSNELLNEIRVKDESPRYSAEPSPNGKSAGAAKQKDTMTDAHKEQLVPHESQRGSLTVSPHSASKPDSLEKSINPEGNQTTAASGRDQQRSHEQQFHNYGPSNIQPKSSGSLLLQSVPPPRAQFPEHAPTLVMPQGPGLLPQPRNPLNSNEQFQPFGRGTGNFGAPHGPPSTAVDQRDGIMGRAPQHGPEGQFGLQHSFNPGQVDMFQSQQLRCFDGDQSKLPGSLDRGPYGRPSGSEPNALQRIGGQGVDSSLLRSQDERSKIFPGEQFMPFSESSWPPDQGSRAVDRTPHGLNYDGLKFGSVSGGPPSRVSHPFHPPGSLDLIDARERELPSGVHENKRGRTEPDRGHPAFSGPGREYLGHPPQAFVGSSSAPRGHLGRDDIDGRETHSFGEGSRSYNLPPDLPGYLRRGELDGPENPRFGEHMGQGPPSSHLRRVDLYGQDIPPNHFRRGELMGPGNSPSHLRFGDPASFGPFPGHARMGEPSGPRNLPHELHFGEPFAGDKPGLPRLGEPGFRSSFSLQGFPNDGPYAVDMDPFDKSRKRKPVSMGWCRICDVDCETVEGLDLHSQTREHQKMAMDMVRSIKQQNKKKPIVANERAVHGEASKTRNTGLEVRGNKL